MRFATVTLAAFLAASVAVAGQAYAQSPDVATPQKKVFGYQDEEGNFHPAVLGVPEPTLGATHSGTIQVTMNISVKAGSPALISGTSSKFICGINLDAVATSISGTTAVVTSHEEMSNVYATGSGSTYTCTVRVPYSWLMPATSLSNSITGSYSVTVQNSALAAGPALLRLSGGEFLSTSAYPTNGATSAFTISVVL